MPPDLSILIVSWNVWPLLRACLTSIEQATRAQADLPPNLRCFGPQAENSAPATVEVIVVDNAGHDETAQALPVQFPWVRFIAAEQNLGFTGGNNLAYSRAQGRFIYFLNPDTELIPTTPGGGAGESLWALYTRVANDESVVLAGPRLFYGDGGVQSSCRRFPTAWTGFFESTWLGRLWPSNPWARRYHMLDVTATMAQVPAVYEVDWVVGAAMLARRAALDAICAPRAAGPFDEGFFMYSEEIDLCRRLKAQGGRIVFTAHAQVRHHEGQSSDQVAAARIIRFNRSKVRYYAKHIGPRWAALLRRYLLLEFRFMLWEERLKLWLGHKPALRAERMAQYRQVLEDGLIGE